MTCTATHTVTQADLDAGHYANTACADDGAGGAAQACASKDVPGTQTPLLSITKAATEASYNAVGQIIHYTIVATNIGNVTLHNVTVADPSVSGLTCNPANGSDLAPGAAMTCSATHTVAQADLDAGHYANTACVDDGAGGAAQACASKDVPGIRQTGALLPTQTTCQQYAAEPSQWPAMYDAFLYQVKSNKINSLSPGVIFYYNTISAPGPSFILNVVQTNGLTWKPMLVQGINQAILYTANCNKASGVTVTTTNYPYTVKFTVTGATPNATYYLGIKYTPSNLVGQVVQIPYPTNTYTWSTTGQAGSTASIPVQPKK
jgi:uncharacterized repeat protein (TIGR01451 family)